MVLWPNTDAGTLPEVEYMNRELHVAKTGNDSNSGDNVDPFLTISKAAIVAEPGDTVVVRAGEYREWVKPRYGGTDNQCRITYAAAPGESVIIKGSEVIEDWEHVEGSVWRSRVPNALFGEWDPYRELLFGDWFIDQGRLHHVGEVFLNGKALFEMDDMEKVLHPAEWEPALDRKQSEYAWYCEQDRNDTVIYANFHEYDPRIETAEISVRRACFYPSVTGLDYITVKGFEMCQAATPWAPPTAEQMGLIGPHWAKGWIIEDNVIHDAKCSGISLGKEQATGENEWTRLKVKHGTQRERDVIFKALRLGWSRETIGSHIVRNNHIYDCGQTGICGHLGAVFSTITGNHIHHIHAKDLFTGHEMAGIKIHAAIDCLIAGNHVHHCTQGIWLDWQAQGLRMTGNLLYDNRWNDIHIEVCHGPYVVDNNLFLSPLSIKNISQGGTYAHNLIGGSIEVRTVPNRFTPYHFEHSTEVKGVMTILCGDDRYYNNIFAPLDPERESQRQIIVVPDENKEHVAEAPTVKPWHGTSFGLSVYDEFPRSTDEWKLARNVDSYALPKLPVFARSNVYCKHADPWVGDENMADTEFDMQVRLEVRGDSVLLHLSADDSLGLVDCPIVTTELLGTAFQAVPYMNPDGTRLDINTDYFGSPRSGSPTVGPFEGLRPGSQTMEV